VQVDTLDIPPVPRVVLKQFRARHCVSGWDVIEHEAIPRPKQLTSSWILLEHDIIEDQGGRSGRVADFSSEFGSTVRDETSDCSCSLPEVLSSTVRSSLNTGRTGKSFMRPMSVHGMWRNSIGSLGTGSIFVTVSDHTKHSTIETRRNSCMIMAPSSTVPHLSLIDSEGVQFFYKIWKIR